MSASADEISAKPFAPANGDPDVSLPAGTIYFKVVGGGAPGIVDVTLH